MIFLPWIVLVLGSGYMIWRGLSEKREYFRRLNERRRRAESASSAQDTAQQVPTETATTRVA